MNREKIKKHFKENRKKWRIQLRRKLERDAFNEKYECYCCGKKETLEVHHLIYTGDKEGFFNEKYWMILCEEHHTLARVQKNARDRAEKGA